MPSKLEFPRKYRLAKKLDFQAVFDQRHKFGRRYALVRYRRNELPHARLGIMISKSQVKLATTRNRLRRVIRESFRHHQESLKGLDLVVIIRSECTLLTKKMWREDFDKLWQALAKSLQLSSST
ncbi:MAG: ribonuclease P protein component [Gammaproteobacteria bacterium]|nr:MAG: ribonuclease P protein component [Gammaproteobacteria bacterium]